MRETWSFAANIQVLEGLILRGAWSILYGTGVTWRWAGGIEMVGGLAHPRAWLKRVFSCPFGLNHRMSVTSL
jgi:hypothetical protein